MAEINLNDSNFNEIIGIYNELIDASEAYENELNRLLSSEPITENIVGPKNMSHKVCVDGEHDHNKISTEYKEITQTIIGSKSSFITVKSQYDMFGNDTGNYDVNLNSTFLKLLATNDLTKLKIDDNITEDGKYKYGGKTTNGFIIYDDTGLYEVRQNEDGTYEKKFKYITTESGQKLAISLTNDSTTVWISEDGKWVHYNADIDINNYLSLEPDDNGQNPFEEEFVKNISDYLDDTLSDDEIKEIYYNMAQEDNATLLQTRTRQIIERYTGREQAFKDKYGFELYSYNEESGSYKYNAEKILYTVYQKYNESFEKNNEVTKLFKNANFTQQQFKKLSSETTGKYQITGDFAIHSLDQLNAEINDTNTIVGRLECEIIDVDDKNNIHVMYNNEEWVILNEEIKLDIFKNIAIGQFN